MADEIVFDQKMADQKVTGNESIQIRDFFQAFSNFLGTIICLSISLIYIKVGLNVTELK